MKFNQTVRNPPPPVAPAVASGPAAQPGPAATGATPSENLVSVLTAANPQEQKQIIGEHLYRQIFSMHPELSGKITGKPHPLTSWRNVFISAHQFYRYAVGDGQL